MVNFLFVIPLVTGYIFASIFPFTESEISRSKGHKLYFYSAFYGVIGHILCIFIFTIYNDFNYIWANGLKCYYFWDSLVAKFKIIKNGEILYLENNILKVYLLNLVLIPLLAIVFKKSLPDYIKYYFIKKSAENKMDFESLFFKSIEKRLPISLTLKSGKVYVGGVVFPKNFQYGKNQIAILPYLSGYRREEDKKIIFTTEYADVYNMIDSGKIKNREQEDFEILISYDEIISGNLFDINIYYKYDRLPTSKKKKRKNSTKRNVKKKIQKNK